MGTHIVSTSLLKIKNSFNVIKIKNSLSVYRNETFLQQCSPHLPIFIFNLSFLGEDCDSIGSYLQSRTKSFLYCRQLFPVYIPLYLRIQMKKKNYPLKQ